MTTTLAVPTRIEIPAVDGFRLQGQAWVHAVEQGGRLPPVVIIRIFFIILLP